MGMSPMGPAEGHLEGGFAAVGLLELAARKRSPGVVDVPGASRRS